MEERQEGRGIGLIILTVVIIIIALVSLAGFLLVRGLGSPADGREDDTVAVSGAYSERIEIEIGRVHSTWWFNFIIHSVDRVDEYAGHRAAPGHQLWLVEITQTGTFFDPILMGTFDWFMDDDDFRSDIFPHVGFEGREEMMPEEFWLDRGQSETHIMLFEVPGQTTNLTLNFIEFGEFETGARFLLNLQQ